ncbi:MAG: tetratricopeptide repeat-containing sensor histidine kinase [Ignavibacteriales bacterium]|nr:tetratricopeptide repeat-containing sensor histidine kinase [Ignavibacteriales bacterium]
MKFFFFIVFSFAALFAQPKLDSLLQAMKGKDDTVVVKKLAALCWEYRSVHPRASIGYGEAALRLLKDQPDNRYKSEVLNFLGVIYGNLGQLDSAYTYYRKAIQVSKVIDDQNQIAYSLNNLGDYYIKNALYSTALENIIEAYQIFEKIQNKQGLAYSVNDIGEIYLIQKDYQKALTYFKRAAQLRRERDDMRGYAKTLINMANVYENLQQYDKAFEVFDEALDASSKVDYVKGKSWIFAGIADLYMKQGKYYYALQNCEKSLAIDTAIANKYGEIINYNRLGSIYMKLSDNTKAKFYLEKAKLESQMTGHIDQLMVANKYITDLFIDAGDYKSAYFSLKDYATLNESIFSQQNLNKIADLQTAFVTEKKEQENELLKKDIEYQKTTIYFVILITVLILAGVGLVISKYKSEKRANLLLKELNSSKDKFFSIIAHDLKGPIGAVSNLADILKTDYTELSEEDRMHIISAFSEASTEVQKLISNLLTWANTQKGGMGVNKSELNIKTMLESITERHKLLASNKNLVLIVEAAADIYISADRYIIETITGNFITNAIKFSYKHTEILISGKRTGNQIEIAVSDSGVGIDKVTLENLLKVESKISTIGTNNEKGTGLGLKICKEFAELHHGTIEIESTEGKGSTFIFRFPA